MARHAAWVDWRGVPAVSFEPQTIANVPRLSSYFDCFCRVKAPKFVYSVYSDNKPRRLLLPRRGSMQNLC